MEEEVNLEEWRNVVQNEKNDSDSSRWDINCCCGNLLIKFMINDGGATMLQTYHLGMTTTTTTRHSWINILINSRASNGEVVAYAH